LSVHQAPRISKFSESYQVESKAAEAGDGRAEANLTEMKTNASQSG
jgi:hypothetical protein